MVRESNGCLLSIVVQGTSLLLGFVLLLTVFAADRISLLRSTERVWITSGLRDYASTLTHIQNLTALGIHSFLAAWPLGSMASMVLLAALGFLCWRLVSSMVVSHGADVTGSDIFGQVLIFIPLAIAVVWVISNAVSPLGLLAFVAGYLGGLVGAIVIAAEFI